MIRQILFWVMFIPLALIMIVLAAITTFFDWLCDMYSDACDKFERWANYE